MKIDKLLAERSGIKLDIGCGANKRGVDWVGMDVRPFVGVDIVWDFNVKPWPLPDESVLTAMCSHVLEHIPKVHIEKGVTRFLLIEFLDEIWRVMKPDGQLAIAVPHGQSPGYMQDPTHVSQINEHLFAYFDPLAQGGLYYGYYKPKPWKIETLDFVLDANIEVVLRKRRMDKSYE